MGIAASAFKQSAFIPAPTLTEKNLPDQHGKVFIVTGSNTGVGKDLVSILFSRNATVYVAARSEPKATDAIKSILAAHPSSKGTLHFLKLDLSDLSTIQASANEFLSKEDKLDVLWNNAGVMIPGPGSKSTQGFELQYATNILGPYLFTKLLLPILKKTAASSPKGSVRVSWAGSLAVDLNSPKGGVTLQEDGSPSFKKEGGRTEEYATSKAANYLLGYEFGKRFGSDGVLHNCFNPGNLKTELQRHARREYGDMALKILDLMLYKSIFGAYTELYAGLSPDLTIEKHQGGFVWPWGRAGTVRSDISAECKTGGKSEKLYEWCERETGKFVSS